MKIDVKNLNFENVKNVDIPDFIFAAPIRIDIISQVVRWQLAKMRSGNASTKTRSDVSGTNRKPWAQKDTGKSRQGSLRCPHFRGGGVVFGPHTRSYEFKLNKKIKDCGIFSILSDRMHSKCLIVMDDFANFFSKTKDFIAWKEKNELGKILFISQKTNNLFNCINNVPYCDVLNSDGMNVLSCINHEQIIFDLDSLNHFIQRYVMFFEDELQNNVQEELNQKNEDCCDEKRGELG